MIMNMKQSTYNWISHLSKQRDDLLAIETTGHDNTVIDNIANRLLEYAHIVEMLSKNHPKIMDELHDSIINNVY